MFVTGTVQILQLKCRNQRFVHSRGKGEGEGGRCVVCNGMGVVTFSNPTLLSTLFTSSSPGVVLAEHFDFVPIITMGHVVLGQSECVGFSPFGFHFDVQYMLGDRSISPRGNVSGRTSRRELSACLPKRREYHE